MQEQRRFSGPSSDFNGIAQPHCYLSTFTSISGKKASGKGNSSATWTNSEGSYMNLERSCMRLDHSWLLHHRLWKQPSLLKIPEALTAEGCNRAGLFPCMYYSVRTLPCLHHWPAARGRIPMRETFDLTQYFDFCPFEKLKTTIIYSFLQPSMAVITVLV